MCPVCLATTAAIVAASATTTGGLTALVLKVTRIRSGTKPADAPPGADARDDLALPPKIEGEREGR
jgi:hypothetical protein